MALDHSPNKDVVDLDDRVSQPVAKADDELPFDGGANEATVAVINQIELLLEMVLLAGSGDDDSQNAGPIWAVWPESGGGFLGGRPRRLPPPLA